MARVKGNTWLGWSYGGGIMSADPQVAAGNGTIYVATLDRWGGVFYRPFTEGTADGWQPWVFTNGLLRSVSPAVVGGELYLLGPTTAMNSGGTRPRRIDGPGRRRGLGASSVATTLVDHAGVTEVIACRRRAVRLDLEARDPDMSELIDNRAHRVRTLKDIIKRLHAGHPPEEVKSQLSQIVRETDYSEIVAMEQELMAEGMPVEEIQSMCDCIRR